MNRATICRAKCIKDNFPAYKGFTYQSTSGSPLNWNKIYFLPLLYWGIIPTVSVFHVESNFILHVITKILREKDFKGFRKLATPKFLFEVH